MNLAKLLVAIGATTTGFRRGIGQAGRSVDDLERKVGRMRKGFGNASAKLGHFAMMAGRVAVIGLVALTLAIGGVTRASIEYEDAFAGVRKTVEATEPQLLQLSKDIRQMSTVIPVAATELAGLAETAGALGVPTKNIKEFVRVTAMLGLTTNVSSAEAADALGRLGNILGLTADDYSKFASALVALGNAGASTESEILEITKRMGSAGKIAGLSTPQIIGWASALASVSGMEPERAGTSMQMFLLNVTKMASKTGPKLTLLARTAGLSGKAFQKLFNKDANAALLKFITGLDKLTKAQKLAVLESLGFTDSGVTRALLGLAKSHAEVARQLGISTAEYEKNIAAQAELDKRLATTKSQLSLLKGILLDVAITLGDAILPVLTPLIKGLGEWITANRELIAQLAGKLATGLGAVVTWLGEFLMKNGPLIASIQTLIWDGLTVLWSVLTTQVIPALFGRGGKGGIIPAVVELGRQIATYVIPKVQAFIDTLTTQVIPSVLKVAGPVVGKLLGAFSAIVMALFGSAGAGKGGGGLGKEASGGLVGALGRLIGVLWGDGEGALAKVLEAVAWAFTDVLEPAITASIGLIEKLIGLLETLAKKWPKTTSPGGLGNPFSFGNPLAQAAGGPVKPGGISLVGEKGPEFVKWGRSAGYVTPADLSAASMAGAAAPAGSGGDTNVTIYNPEPRAADDDIGRVMRRLSGLGLVGAPRMAGAGG